MPDVEDPARIVAQVAAHRLLDQRPGDDLGIDRLLQHAVVEKARRAIGNAVHRDQPDVSGRRVERLGEPRRIARNFVGGGSAGHAAP